MDTENLFKWQDYVMVVGTLLFSVGIGLYFGFVKKQNTEDLLLGGKSMGVFPIAASMLVTYLSAVQVLGYPSEIYGYGSQIFMSTLTFAAFSPLGMYFFMTVFYDMELTSVYEYLENRFKSVFVRLFTSFIFILQMTFYMGVCLFAPSIAMSTFMGLELWQSVLGLGLCATVYTSMGGLKAVVWTDVFQMVMVLAGMVAIMIRGFYKAGGIAPAFEKAYEHGRLELFNFNVDPFQRHNTLNIVLGIGFACFSGFATHQPQVQRYKSLPTLGHAVRGALLTLPLNILTVGLCVLSGIAIFSSYAGCDPMALGRIPTVDAIVPYFVKHELTFLPGMMGLFTACVFSASLSTLSSGLNSLAAVTWEDFLCRFRFFRKLSPSMQAHMIRFIAILFGVASMAIAFAAQRMGSILSATLTALGALMGPLGMIFVMGVLVPFINKPGAICGMVTGFLVMVWISMNAFILGKSHITMDFSADECPANMTATYNPAIHVQPAVEFPEKLYTLSYILYSFVGGVITFVVAAIVSIATGGISQMKDIEPQYLHPLVRPRKKISPPKEKEMQQFNSKYTQVIPPPTPQYAKITQVSQDSPHYYSYEAPTPTWSNGSRTSYNDSASRPLLYKMPSSDAPVPPVAPPGYNSQPNDQATRPKLYKLSSQQSQDGYPRTMSPTQNRSSINGDVHHPMLYRLSSQETPLHDQNGHQVLYRMTSNDSSTQTSPNGNVSPIPDHPSQRSSRPLYRMLSNASTQTDT